MSNYLNFLIVIVVLALCGIGIFMMDFSDLSWQNNKASYWGILAMFAIIGFSLLNSHSRRLVKRIKAAESKVDREYL